MSISNLTTLIIGIITGTIVGYANVAIQRRSIRRDEKTIVLKNIGDYWSDEYGGNISPCAVNAGGNPCCGYIEVNIEKIRNRVSEIINQKSNFSLIETRSE